MRSVSSGGRSDRLDPGEVNINVSQRIEGSSFAKISNADWVLATELFPDRLIQLQLDEEI